MRFRKLFVIVRNKLKMCKRSQPVSEVHSPKVFYPQRKQIGNHLSANNQNLRTSIQKNFFGGLREWTKEQIRVIWKLPTVLNHRDELTTYFLYDRLKARLSSNLFFIRRRGPRGNFAGTLHSSSLLNLRRVQHLERPNYNRSKSLFSPQHTSTRRLHTSLTTLQKNKDNNSTSNNNSGSSTNNSKSAADECVPLGDICENADLPKTCKKVESPCHAKKAKCEPPKAAPIAKKKAKRVSKCRDTCLPRGICEELHTPKPPKMEYKSAECPSPKFVPLQPCPAIPVHEEEVEANDVSNSKNWKEVCPPPPPLPEPPHGPIVLCPCPPPTKLRPGPCPCHHERTIIKPPAAAHPCPPKEPYPCPDTSFYCPMKKMECEFKKPCKSKKKNDTEKA